MQKDIHQFLDHSRTCWGNHKSLNNSVHNFQENSLINLTKFQITNNDNKERDDDNDDRNYR